jgi:hypothetical protein
MVEWLDDDVVLVFPGESCEMKMTVRGEPRVPGWYILTLADGVDREI